MKTEDILKLGRSGRYRIIRTGRELLDAISDSLDRLQKKLHDETPAVVFLWDHVSTREKLYKPKAENEFADFVQLHLKDDLRSEGIVPYREVRIRAARGSTPGERTDILVTALGKDEEGKHSEPLTAIIEAKGCWNDELDVAMKAQLVDRYLKDNTCQHGLYLVAWFDSDCWLEDDNRKSKRPKTTLNEARTKYREQARQLSHEGLDIRAHVVDASLC